MYVQWERQIRSTDKHRAHYELVALLVESPFSKKKDRVKVLAELGSIQERFLRMRISKTRAFHQGLFWAKVDRNLGKLCLKIEVQQTLESQILNKVPRPGDDWALWGVTCIPRIDCY